MTDYEFLWFFHIFLLQRGLSSLWSSWFSRVVSCLLCSVLNSPLCSSGWIFEVLLTFIDLLHLNTVLGLLTCLSLGEYIIIVFNVLNFFPKIDYHPELPLRTLKFWIIKDTPQDLLLLKYLSFNHIMWATSYKSLNTPRLYWHCFEGNTSYALCGLLHSHSVTSSSILHLQKKKRKKIALYSV